MATSDKWSEDDMGDQSGRVAVVTGANSGIGFETARALAQRGADVILACRNPERAADARERIETLSPAGSVHVLLVDLGDLDSVAGACAEFRARFERLDLLVNNAGAILMDEGTTAQGFETHIGVNHLGHFALTGGLLPVILATEGSRIVTVSSMGHRSGTHRTRQLSRACQLQGDAGLRPEQGCQPAVHRRASAAARASRTRHHLPRSTSRGFPLCGRRRPSKFPQPDHLPRPGSPRVLHAATLVGCTPHTPSSDRPGSPGQ